MCENNNLNPPPKLPKQRNNEEIKPNIEGLYFMNHAQIWYVGCRILFLPVRTHSVAR